jgi:hypothetical protein
MPALNAKSHRLASNLVFTHPGISTSVRTKLTEVLHAPKSSNKAVEYLKSNKQIGAWRDTVAYQHVAKHDDLMLSISNLRRSLRLPGVSALHEPGRSDD